MGNHPLGTDLHTLACNFCFEISNCFIKLNSFTYLFFLLLFISSLVVSLMIWLSGIVIVVILSARYTALIWYSLHQWMGLRWGQRYFKLLWYILQGGVVLWVIIVISTSCYSSETFLFRTWWKNNCRTLHPSRFFIRWEKAFICFVIARLVQWSWPLLMMP